jgi:hypothetical protein
MILSWFQWLESTGIGNAIRLSPWAFAVIESVHLLGLAVIGGAVLLVCLRQLGFGLRGQAIADVARDAYPWLAISWVVMILTGGALFVSEAVKCYYSTPFWVKMTSLLLATIFTFAVQQRVARADETRVGPMWQKLVALVSLVLWFGVGAGGRWIGFSG